MISRLSKVVFGIEVVLFIAFVLTVVPSRPGGSPLISPSPGLLSLVVVAGYCVLGIGFLLYCFVAASAAFGRVSEFWQSFVPAIAALPILTWGAGKLQASAGTGVMSLGLLAAALIAGLIIARTAAISLRALPISLIAVCLAAADFPWAWVVYLPVGALLLIAPLWRQH